MLHRMKEHTSFKFAFKCKELQRKIKGTVNTEIIHIKITELK